MAVQSARASFPASAPQLASAAAQAQVDRHEVGAVGLPCATPSSSASGDADGAAIDIGVDVEASTWSTSNQDADAMLVSPHLRAELRRACRTRAPAVEASADVDRHHHVDRMRRRPAGPERRQRRARQPAQAMPRRALRARTAPGSLASRRRRRSGDQEGRIGAPAPNSGGAGRARGSARLVGRPSRRCVERGGELADGFARASARARSACRAWSRRTAARRQPVDERMVEAHARSRRCQRTMRPDCGRKSCAGSSAHRRTSIAWPPA